LLIKEALAFDRDVAERISSMQAESNLQAVARAFESASEATTDAGPSPRINYQDLNVRVILDPQAAATAYVEGTVLGLRSKEYATPCGAPKLDELSQALGLLVRNPTMSNKDIAEVVGVNSKTLNKRSWKQFQDARRAIRGSAVPRGKKVDGRLEAIDDNEE
jgi:hypothetical protein